MFSTPSGIPITDKRPTRPGALCTRAVCIAAKVDRIKATGKGTLYLTSTGQIATYHDRGKNSDRAAHGRFLAKAYGRCLWCGTEICAETVERDRLIDGCEYSQRNLMAACFDCNRERSNTPADEFAMTRPNPEYATASLATVRALDPIWHAAS